MGNHPALKAVSPQAPVTDWFIGDDFHHNGAFFAMDGFSFYSTFGKPHPVPVKDYGEGFTTPIKDNYKFYLQAGAVKNLAAMIGDSIKFWHELYQHPTYDAWWKARNARVGLYNVKPAMLWVGGLFDAEDCFVDTLFESKHFFRIFCTFNLKLELHKNGCYRTACRASTYRGSHAATCASRHTALAVAACRYLGGAGNRL